MISPRPKFNKKFSKMGTIEDVSSSVRGSEQLLTFKRKNSSGVPFGKLHKSSQRAAIKNQEGASEIRMCKEIWRDLRQAKTKSMPDLKLNKG